MAKQIVKKLVEVEVEVEVAERESAETPATEVAYQKGDIAVVFCTNYIYTGQVLLVSDLEIVLKDPKIVYETGAFSDKQWKAAESLPTTVLRIQRAAIESHFKLER